MIMSKTQEQQGKETKIQTHKMEWINGRKWNEKTYGGGSEMSCHLEEDVLQDECVSRHLRAS